MKALHRTGRVRLAFVAVVAFSTAALNVLPASASGSSSWLMSGQNIGNTRYNAAESTINSSNASQLAAKWTFTTHGSVSATPAVVGNTAYFPDWGGYLNAVNTRTGQVMWQVPISSYEIKAGYVTQSYVDAMQAAGGLLKSRTSPAIADNVVYIGDQGTSYLQRFVNQTTGKQDGNVISPGGSGNGDHLFAINGNNGQLIWSQTLDSHVAAIDTQAPVVYNGTVYVGSASNEEAFGAESSTYFCCTFRGSFEALKANNGARLWQTYMLPASDVNTTTKLAGYSGDAVWGSTGAVDPTHNAVYIGTGNNYTSPDACRTSDQCDQANNHFDSVVALDLTSGATKWYSGTQAMDAWNASCLASIGLPGFNYRGNCPPGAGPDYDFGSGPMLTTVNGKEVVVAGSKSGEVWEFPTGATGGGSVAPTWGNPVGPGSTLGGVEWGSATDGTRIYVAEANYGQQPVTLTAGTEAGKTICTGFWAAINPADGTIAWETPVQPEIDASPTGQCSPNFSNLAIALGPVSVANGVVYVGDLGGTMHALDATSGTELWSYNALANGGGSSNASPAIVNGVLYWGNGYQIGVNSTKFYAFSLNGQ